MHLFMHDRARVSTTVRQPLLVLASDTSLPSTWYNILSRLKVVLFGHWIGTRPLTQIGYRNSGIGNRKWKKK